MPVSRQADLRANQKARTRSAIVDAAAALLREGAPPTVPDAAARAKVSRATAYRYFPTQESLLVEASSIRPSVEPIERLLTELKGDDVEQRLASLLGEFNRILLDEEALMRTALRVYLDAWLEQRRNGDDTPVREGRRIRWFDEALAPARDQLAPAQYKKLRAALALTTGVEAIIVQRDVCHIVDDDELLANLEWAATTLLRAALQQPEPARTPRHRRR